jgi:hypothetical protein
MQRVLVVPWSIEATNSANCSPPAIVSIMDYAGTPVVENSVCALQTAEEVRRPRDCGAEVHQADVGIDRVDGGERGDRGDHAVDIV